MAGTPKIRAKRMTELSAFADRPWVELELITPETVFQNNADQFHLTWSEAYFGAMELNVNLLTLRDLLRKRARLPKLSGSIDERAKEAQADAEQLKKSQARPASTG